MEKYYENCKIALMDIEENALKLQCSVQSNWFYENMFFSNVEHKLSIVDEEKENWNTDETLSPPL